MTDQEGDDGLAARRCPRVAEATGPGQPTRRTQRDLLPLPRVAGEFGVHNRALSRAVRQRIQRRMHVFEQMNDVIDAINSLAGFKTACTLEPSARQLDTFEYLEAAVRDAKPPLNPPPAEEDVRALLGI